jgi:uncharacterized protein (DUF58 family)
MSWRTRMAAKLKGIFRGSPVLIQRDDGNRKSVLELRSWYPIILLIVILVWHVHELATTTAIGLGALLGILFTAFVWSRAMLNDVVGKRTLVYRAIQVGDELEETVEVFNESRLPVLWTEFVDNSDLPGYTISSVRGLNPNMLTQWRAGAICNRRGLFHLGPWELRMGDPFGIFNVCHMFHEPEEILVFPPLARLPAGLMPRGGSQGEFLLVPQPLHADTVNASFVRPYVPGDPLRQIHWPTTARRFEPYVKGFEPEGTSTIWIVLDMDGEAHFGEGQNSSEEVMIMLAASLAREYLQTGLSVGLFAHGTERVIIPPQRSRTHFWTLLRGLAPLRASASRPLAKTIVDASAVQSSRHLSVVITPSLNTEWSAKINPFASSSHGGVMAILLDSGDPEQSGKTEAAVLELSKIGIRTRVVVPASVKPIYAAYGELHRWEFTQLGTGAVVTRSQPRATMDLSMRADK